MISLVILACIVVPLVIYGILASKEIPDPTQEVGYGIEEDGSGFGG
jgi:hypothetical protein